MEESPHKCPVCSRSFNQRSNLKTHLLTHTDHKPYECNSCGKVFRRNCDLRRHALTHAVGDVLPEGMTPEGYSLPGGPNPEGPSDMSPRPRSPERRSEHYPPRCQSPVERTKCHHGESSSTYTMRPSPPDDHLPPPTHQPQLHIRRDLHQVKPSPTSTITASSDEPPTLFRKRTHEATEVHEPPRAHVSTVRAESTDSNPEPGPSTSPPCSVGTVTDLTVKRDLAPDRPPPPPPKKHGFSIEDIMRRD